MSAVRIVAILGGGLVGLVVGYFIGVYAACDWLIPTSNLCGIYGVFLTGPVGLVCGAVGVWAISRPKGTVTGNCDSKYRWG
jgi:hypothetical protein